MCRLYCVILDDGAVTEKIVNLSVIIVMACYMVEMTPWCIMGRWTLAGAGVANTSAAIDIPAITSPEPGTRGSKAQTVSVGQARVAPCVPINVHSGLRAESDNKM